VQVVEFWGWVKYFLLPTILFDVVKKFGRQLSDLTSLNNLVDPSCAVDPFCAWPWAPMVFSLRCCRWHVQVVEFWGWVKYFLLPTILFDVVKKFGRTFLCYRPFLCLRMPL